MPVNKNARRLGSFFVFMSALLFSLGGACICFIPWSPLAINGARSLLSVVIISVYLIITRHRPVINKSVILGALCMAAMMNSYVIANKLTSAANAIVLQFTAPVFIIIFMMLFFHQKPEKLDIITCILVLCGIICFFFDDLSGGGYIGNAVAILSGALYAGVFMLRMFPKSDPISSVLFGHCICAVIGVPFVFGETVFDTRVIIAVVILGVFQLGIAYIFFTEGIKTVAPVSASLLAGIEPILNPVFAAILVGQFPGAVSIIGAVVVVASIITYNVIKDKKSVKSA